MSKTDDLTYAAIAGYESAKPECVEYIETSTAWYAWKLGQYLSFTGRAKPVGVRMSRGYSIRCGDMLFKIKDHATFERTA